MVSPNSRTARGILCGISVSSVRQVLILALGARQSAPDATGRGIDVRQFGSWIPIFLLGATERKDGVPWKGDGEERQGSMGEGMYKV